MNKVVEFLNANPVQYLATVGRDGKAKCRPFMFAGELDGKLWFCTNNTKDVYKDMQENPEAEISVSSPEYAWIRLHGKAVGPCRGQDPRDPYPLPARAQRLPAHRQCQGHLHQLVHCKPVRRQVQPASGRHQPCPRG